MKKRKKRMLKGEGGDKGRYPRNSKKFKISGVDEEGTLIDVKMGCRKVHRVANKYSGHHSAWVDYSLIRRYLEKRAGQPWNDVWQEICADYDSRSYEGYQVREWMDYNVEKNCTIDEDGTVRDDRGLRLGGSWSRDEFYVHPDTGLLCIAHGRRWRRETAPQKVFEMDGTLYHEHEGIWYRVEMKLLEKIQRTRYHRDYRTGTVLFSYKYSDWQAPMREAFHISDWSFNSSYSYTQKLKNKYGLSPKGEYWYCSKKESANGREIAKLRRLFRMEASAAA